ncbi:hypothetical protein FB451DRAFT_1182651 [Mycena latifolia]|nr:hypothetical protein FB451DRAFT_1182651 [Mycena latifolia]
MSARGRRSCVRGTQEGAKPRAYGALVSPCTCENPKPRRGAVKMRKSRKITLPPPAELIGRRCATVASRTPRPRGTRPGSSSRGRGSSLGRRRCLCEAKTSQRVRKTKREGKGRGKREGREREGGDADADVGKKAAVWVDNEKRWEVCGWTRKRQRKAEEGRSETRGASRARKRGGDGGGEEAKNAMRGRTEGERRTKSRRSAGLAARAGNEVSLGKRRRRVTEETPVTTPQHLRRRIARPRLRNATPAPGAHGQPRLTVPRTDEDGTPLEKYEGQSSGLTTWITPVARQTALHALITRLLARRRARRRRRALPPWPRPA